MPLDLVVNPLPVPQLASLPPECDDDTDGLQTFDLSTVAATDVIGAQTDMVVSCHETDADAQAGVSPLGNTYLHQYAGCRYHTHTFGKHANGLL